MCVKCDCVCVRGANIHIYQTNLFSVLKKSSGLESFSALCCFQGFKVFFFLYVELSGSDEVSSKVLEA